MSGYLDLLDHMLAGRLNAEEAQVLARAQKGCVTMSGIVGDLLLLAQMHAGSEGPTCTAVAMSSVVDNARERLAAQIEERRASLTVCEGWPHVWGHAGWIEEVWINYISNALKYGGEPPVMRLGFDPPANGVARFWVQDAGAGIEPEDRELIFREFSRLHRSRADSHGLGLAIAKRIVERLDGRVGVESEVGRGSRFWFTLRTV